MQTSADKNVREVRQVVCLNKDVEATRVEQEEAAVHLADVAPKGHNRDKQAIQLEVNTWTGMIAMERKML